jgi:hypothetical protein
VTNDRSLRAPVEPKPDPISIEYAFNGLCTMRNGEPQSRWGAAQLGIVLNIPALAAALFRLVQGPAAPELYMFLVGSLFLVATNVFWRAILKRRENFLENWNEKLEELERKHGIEGGIMIFSSTDYLRMRAIPQRIAVDRIGMYRAVGSDSHRGLCHGIHGPALNRLPCGGISPRAGSSDHA